MIADAAESLKRPERKFLPEDFQPGSWEQLAPWFDNLLERPINSADDLRRWFSDRSELESVVSEDLAWRYIRMTCYTDNQEYADRYQDFVQNIQPRMAPVTDKLNRKAADCPYLDELASEEGFDILIRNLRKDIEIFREENIPIFTEITTETQKYAQISGAMTVEVEGKTLTLQQASVYLLSPDRQKREEVYRKINARRQEDRGRLDELFTRLIKLRHQVAVNAGFANFRDYMFKALGRFDYTPQDCFAFHDAIEHEVVPLLNEFAADRKRSLGVDSLRPWDKAVDPQGREALKPFTNAEEL